MKTTIILKNTTYAVVSAFLITGIALADNLLFNPDFEIMEITGDYYGSDGGWYGDDSAIVTAENGITPHSGSQMLHFIHAHRYGTAVGGSGSQVYQLVDLTPFTDQIETGIAIANASYWVNRVQGDAYTDTKFGIRFLAMDNIDTSLAYDEYFIETDDNVGTWELVEHQLLIPVGTTKLRLQLHASENVYNDTTGVEFDGHYGDSACLTISSLPVEWPVASGGNGHFYEAVAVPAGITWTAAQADAVAREGYLATVTSAAENAFVYALSLDAVYWNGAYGPWLGGWQPAGNPEPDGNWQWITGEPWSYENWRYDQPNEFQNEGEDRIHYWYTDEWNDNTAEDITYAYVIESQIHAGATGNLNVAIRGDTNVAAGYPLDLTGMLDGIATMLVWDFGDGMSATNDQFPSHTWDVPDDYEVVLTAYNENHPSGVSATQTIHILIDEGAVVRWIGNDHKYQVIVASNRITWAEAQSDAAMRGGYLATATSEAENQFIFDLINSTNYLNPVVLGATQPPGSPEPDGNWQWITGEPWGYENWYAGYTIEPNNFRGPQNIIQYWGREPASWDDTSRAGGLHSYVVEYQFHDSATGGLSLAIGGDSTLAAGHPSTLIGMLDGVATMLIWDFDDGSYATNRQFVSHSWTMPGDYDVVLRAFNETLSGGVAATQTFHVISQEDATAYVTTDGNDSNDGSSWASAKATIQGGVDAVAPGGVVYVSNGTYAVSNEIQLHKSIIVQSVSDPEETIVDGGGSNRCFSLGYDCILSGFTVSNGYDGLTGGGILSDDNASIITNCIIIGNTSVDSGGGVRNGTLHDCTVSQNTSLNHGGGLNGGVAYDCIFSFNTASNNGGGIHGSTAYGCELVGNIAVEYGGGARNSNLFDCDVVGNQAKNGGGSHSWSGRTLTDCRIVGNTAANVAGGIYFGAEGAAVNCTISSNSAAHGGGVYCGSGGTLVGCSIAGNTAGINGGGSRGGTLNNCTLSDNTASNLGGGSYIGQLNNCIVYFNAALSSGNNWYDTTPDFSYSCTTPDPGGTGIITNAPMFTSGENYRLATNSPCINAGHNNYALLNTDLDGNPRMVGGVVDMGAYERQDAGMDVDGDGMEDWWEMMYLVGRHFAEPDALCPNGINFVLEAYIAGLDPTNSGSTFTSTNVHPDASGFVIEWAPSMSNRLYAVNWSTNLTNDFQTLETGIEFPQNSFTDTVHAAENQGFYQVEVQMK